MLKRGNSPYNNLQGVLYYFVVLYKICKLSILACTAEYVRIVFISMTIKIFVYTLNTKSEITKGWIDFIWSKEFRLKGNVQWNISEKGACLNCVYILFINELLEPEDLSNYYEVSLSNKYSDQREIHWTDYLIGEERNNSFWNISRSN